MPSYKAPGAYVDEVLNPSTAITGPSASLGAFLAPNARGPVAATLISSWPQFLALFGGFTDPTMYLPWAVHQFFSNGGRECYVARVTGTGAATATRSLNDRAGTPVPTLRVDALNAGAWGNSVYVDIVDSGTTQFTIIVRYGGTSDAYIVERWLDLSMNTTDNRYAPNIVNAVNGGSRYIAVTDLNSATAAPNDRPSAQIATALAGGADGAAPTATQMQTALTVLDQINSPFNLNLPGTVDTATVNAAIAYGAARGDVFTVCSVDQNLTATAAVTAAQAYTQSSYAACYYPWLYVDDPSVSTPGALKKIPPGGAVLGQLANTDSVRGVWKAPAGTNNRIAGALALETKLSQADLETLFAGNVNVIRQLPGFGICIYGARTLKTGAIDKYISARRTLIYIRRALLDGTQWAVFEPNDAVLWSALKTQIEKFLLSLWQAGGLAGSTASQAFYVVCDTTNNPPPAIAGGEVHIEIGVALEVPAEFVIFKIGQWSGGTTVQESVGALAAA